MGKEIIIIGCGIAGLTTAIALHNIGIRTTIFEAAPNIKPIGAGLGLAANAIKAFKNLDLADEVIRYGRVLDSFSIYDQKGKLISRTNTQKLREKHGVDNFTIHRAELHQLLLSKIDSQCIISNKKVINIDQKKNSVIVTFQDGSTHESEFLIAADGVHSQIRKTLIPDSDPRFAGYTCWRAVIDNSNLNLKESSETWGRGKRFGIVPLAGNKIYWFACTNAKRNDPVFENFTVTDLLDHFSSFHEPVPTIIIETADEALIWNDIIDIKPISQYAHDKILLIGDAAHATTPNMGQGACQAIEDAVVLASEIKKEIDTDIKQAFINFEKRRLKRTHQIVDTSWKIGKIAQLDNKFLVGIRNFAFRLMPGRLQEKQLEKLYDVKF